MTIYQNDQPIALDAIKDHKVIFAAGGIVKNEKNEILMIYRLDKWDFPKGKMEDEESFEETAIREVEEETGLHDLAIQEELPATFHIYQLQGKTILKETHWYKMTAPYQTLIPQTEEDITKAVWIPMEQVSEKLSNSYATLRDLWKNYLSN